MNLDKELKQRGITYYKLGRALGLRNLTTVYRWKQGLNKPSPLYEKYIRAFLDNYDNKKRKK